MLMVNATISIAMALDENFLYPTLVSMTSLLENKHRHTRCCFYLLYSSETLSKAARAVLLSLGEKYSKCEIILIDVSGLYNDITDNMRVSVPTYYRLSLSALLPELDRIIWLDGDTLVLHDLRDMFVIDMEGYYYRGFLDDRPDAVDEFDINNDHYICAGVLLINLKELRQDNMVEKFTAFIAENKDRLQWQDQTVINVVGLDKTGILPIRYGIFNYLQERENRYYSGFKNIRNYLEALRSTEKYTFSEAKRAMKNPSILHCPSKPWDCNVHVYREGLWLKYAKKTAYYTEIERHYQLNKFQWENRFRFLCKANMALLFDYLDRYTTSMRVFNYTMLVRLLGDQRYERLKTTVKNIVSERR